MAGEGGAVEGDDFVAGVGGERTVSRLGGGKDLGLGGEAGGDVGDGVGGAGRGFHGGAFGAGVDPIFDDVEFGGGEAAAVHGHEGLFLAGGHEIEAAFIGLAGGDNLAVVAAGADAADGFEVERTHLDAMGVAIEAVLAEDGLQVRFEVLGATEGGEQ
jgi:hypothetical protein